MRRTTIKFLTTLTIFLLAYADRADRADRAGRAAGVRVGGEVPMILDWVERNSSISL